jgi:glycolate oxidase
VSIALPDIDESVVRRRSEIVYALREIVPGEGVIDREIEMKPYETDG